ncbi:hypothetical protein [Amaricoccus macauensis]|uniref:hypothetical protein n=1 Tax=Amaricoccus macauensis TaxID=57001 RepID=UPI003C7DA344
MITPEEIVDMTDLSPDEVELIEKHEYLGCMVAAAAMADYLMHQHKGPQAVQRMICDEIRGALHANDLKRARELYETLHHFMSEHPEAAHGSI